MPTLSSTPTLLEAVQYVADLTARVQSAKKRVYIASMIINDDPSTAALIDALKKAATRGVEVNIMLDTFTFREFGGYFNPFRRHKKRSREAIETMNQLTQAGVSVTWLGPRLVINPFAGVTHIKWSVVDNMCYTFGGVNLYHDGVQGATDYMIRIQDAPLADALIQEQLAVIKSPRPLYKGSNQTSPLGNWFVDSGIRKESFIYDRVLELAKKAESITYVSQYCPSGPLAKILSSKKHVSYYFNNPQNAPFPTSLMLQMDQHLTGIYSQYKRTKYIHAKVILFTLPDGKKIAVTGSHNFSYKGVIFGTREVALETDNPAIIGQIEDFLSEHIK